MPPDNHSQRVLDLAGQKGLLRASDLKTINAPRVVLARMTVAGLVDKVGAASTGYPATRRPSRKLWPPLPFVSRKPCFAC